MGRTALAKWESFKSKIAQKQARDRSKRVDRSSCERNYRSRKSWWPRENLREESLVAHLRQPFERSRCDDSRTAGELAHHSAIGRPSIRTTIPKRPDTPVSAGTGLSQYLGEERLGDCHGAPAR
jgi:hypothetical protein